MLRFIRFDLCGPCRTVRVFVAFNIGIRGPTCAAGPALRALLIE